MFNKIAEFIIKEVQQNSDNSMSGFQYIVDYEEIERKFLLELAADMIQNIEEALNHREEVADVILDQNGFDVVLYTDYAPNYIGEEG